MIGKEIETDNLRERKGMKEIHKRHLMICMY